MEPQEPATVDIQASLSGRRILITGATGFIGKVLVEKLLWAVPDLGRLLLLVRPDGERSAARRLREEILDSPIMARLQALHCENWEAWATSKVEVVAGDLGRERFGLDPAAYATLAHRVDRIVAAAATVAFDERLDRALELNVRGALRTLELARDAGAAPLVHLSTCFVSGRRTGSIAECLADAAPGEGGRDSAANPAAVLAALDRAARESAGQAAQDEASQGEVDRSLRAAGANLAARHGFHDVYTLTKALAEQLLEGARGEVPLVILRPAIVESAAAEPIRGWIDAVRVADPLLVAYGRGQTRVLPGAAGARLEIVPVDFVVHATIAALAELAPDSKATRVYQVSSARHPITLGELLDFARRGFGRMPLRDARDRPIAPRRARYLEPRRYARRLGRQKAWAARFARWLRPTRFGPRLLAAERTLGHFQRLFEIYRPYLDHGARYEDTATRALWNRLAPEAQSQFPFDVAALDWPSYIADAHVPGLVRFALRGDSGLPSPPGPSDAELAATHGRGDFPAAEAATLYELFATAASACPGGVALQTCRGGRWLRYTYGQALDAIDNVAARLALRHGVGLGDRVALWGRATPEWVLTSFAVHRLGAVTVPLDPQWQADDVARAVRFTAAKLLCAAPELRPALDDPALEISCPTMDLAAPFVPAPDVGPLPGVARLAPAAAASGLASILFTSGTTSSSTALEPKAVPLTHANFMANVRDLVPVMRSSRERLLSVLPIHHVFEFTVGLLVPLAGNGTISYVEELKPAEIRWMMAATQPTMLVAVPRLLELLHHGIQRNVEAGGPAMKGLFRALFGLSALTGGRCGRLLFGAVHRRFGGALARIATGGSALEPELGRRFQLMGFRVAEGYGMTETSPVLTVNPWDAIRFGSVGRPLAGVEVDIRPAQEAGLEPGTGEIWVRGANVMVGYYRNVDASREVLRHDWLNTGDVGFFDGDGYLHIAGRTKDVIVTGAGKNVYPEEVERRYRDLEPVQELVALGLPGEARGERVGAVAVPQPEASDEAVRAAVAARAADVPSYQQISRLEIWRGELPKTTTMKVKRGLLREALLAREKPAERVAERTPEPAPPPGENARGENTSEVFAALARLTRSRAELLTASDRLAELGVDSLTKVELLSELEGRFGLVVDDETAAGVGSVQDLLDLVPPDAAGAA